MLLYFVLPYITIHLNNENIKEIMGVKGKPDFIDIIEKKRPQWYGHVKRMPEERIPKLIWNGYQRRGEKENVLEKHGWKKYTQS
jgi:hypothetical protein